MLTQPIRGVTPYKIEDFEVLGLVWAAPFTLAVKGDAPYNSLKELAEYGKKNQLKLGHYGLGAVPTLIAMGIADKGGFKWQETAFDSVGGLLLTSGDMDAITATMPSLVDYTKTKQVKILAVMNPVHYPLAPGVKTVSEQGFGDDYFVWFGIFAPKGTPSEVLKKFEASWFKAMEAPEVKKVLKNTGVIPIKMGAEEAKKQIAREHEHFKKLMTDLQIIK
jgi:tripartite-type tricarboxylate transporter receptor subunit TctC